MNKKYLIVLVILFLFAITAVNAHENDTNVDEVISATDNSVVSSINDQETITRQDDDNLISLSNDKVVSTFNDDNVVSISNEDAKLEKSYFYDAKDYREYDDDTVVTHNLVKYYGDKSKRFKVIVYDDDYYRESGVCVSFGKTLDNLREKTTNYDGVVYFSVNYKVGTHKVITYIECDDGKSYYYAINKVKIKSTIPTKKVGKYINQKNKKFKIKFLNTKGKPLVNKKVKIKIRNKFYKIKTNGKGIAKIKINCFKVGNYKITAYNPVSKEKRKITVKILKKVNFKTVTIKVKSPNAYSATKKLSNGDRIYSTYENLPHRQYEPGVYIEVLDGAGGLESAKHTKLLKAKFYFKNSHGDIVTKTSSKVHYNSLIKSNLVNGYKPFKIKLWYINK